MVLHNFWRCALVKETRTGDMEFKKSTYSTQAAEYVSEMIRSGRLRPGQPIRECMLSEELGISRAPIREALLLLVEKGLVCSEPHRGKSVRSLSPQEIYDSYMVAGILEGAGVALSALLWKKDQEEAFERVVDLVGRIRPDADADLLAAIDEKFHMTLLAACPSEHLVSLARHSSASIAKFLYYREWGRLFTPEQYRARHLEVARAVRTKEPFVIEEALRRHYAETGRLLSLSLEAAADPPSC